MFCTAQRSPQALFSACSSFKRQAEPILSSSAVCKKHGNLAHTGFFTIFQLLKKRAEPAFTSAEVRHTSKSCSRGRFYAISYIKKTVPQKHAALLLISGLFRELGAAGLADDIDLNLSRIFQLILDALGNLAGEYVSTLVGNVLRLDHDANLTSGLDGE